MKDLIKNTVQMSNERDICSLGIKNEYLKINLVTTKVNAESNSEYSVNKIL